MVFNDPFGLFHVQYTWFALYRLVKLCRLLNQRSPSAALLGPRGVKRKTNAGNSFLMSRHVSETDASDRSAKVSCSVRHLKRSAELKLDVGDRWQRHVGPRFNLGAD